MSQDLNIQSERRKISTPTCCDRIIRCAPEVSCGSDLWMLVAETIPWRCLTQQADLQISLSSLTFLDVSVLVCGYELLPAKGNNCHWLLCLSSLACENYSSDLYGTWPWEVFSITAGWCQPLVLSWLKWNTPNFRQGHKVTPASHCYCCSRGRYQQH